jgi:hypothetical protein
MDELVLTALITSADQAQLIAARFTRAYSTEENLRAIAAGEHLDRQTTELVKAASSIMKLYHALADPPRNMN